MALLVPGEALPFADMCGWVAAPSGHPAHCLQGGPAAGLSISSSTPPWWLCPALLLATHCSVNPVPSWPWAGLHCLACLIPPHLLSPEPGGLCLASWALEAQAWPLTPSRTPRPVYYFTDLPLFITPRSLCRWPGCWPRATSGPGAAPARP